MPNKPIESRSNHQYAPPGEERTTPLEEIPPEHRRKSVLPGGGYQITDNRLCYNWEPGPDGGRLVECGSVAADASKLGAESPESKSKK